MTCLVLALIVTLPGRARPGDLPGNWDDWQLVELQVNGSPLCRQQGSDFQPVPKKHRTGHAKLLYAVRLEAGGAYSLGIEFLHGVRPVSVCLYDRWPNAPAARQIHLPQGPLVKTRGGPGEIVWQFNLSPQSEGNILYFTVESDGLGKNSEIPITVALYSPARKAADNLARGITYLQGPVNLKLAADPFVVAVLAGGAAGPAHAEQFPGEDLIANGDFAAGLAHWQKYGGGVMPPEVQNTGSAGDCLVLAGNGKAVPGIMQTINADISRARSLVLSATIMIGQQDVGAPSATGSAGCLEIAVDYEAVDSNRSGRNCLFRQNFCVDKASDQESSTAPAGETIGRGRWHRYKFDLLRLQERPRYINNIVIETQGRSADAFLIRDVHLMSSGD